MVCTNRPNYARVALDHLDAQDTDFHIYIVLNSSDAAFCMGLVDYCSKLDHSVTLIRLWSMTTQIGLAYNCAMWHAMKTGDRVVRRYVKIDDDVAIKPNGIRELHRLCSEADDKCVAVLLPYSKGGYYGYRNMVSNKVKGDYKFIYGACFMLPARIRSEIGYFTEDAQRGMDLDYAVRVQRAGYEVVNHPSLRALHLGTMNGTEITPQGKKSRKYCTFGEHQVCGTIWDLLEVRQALIAQVFGDTSRTQDERAQKPLDSTPVILHT